MFYGDTTVVPSGVGTFGSRTAAVEGGSLALAARAIVDKAKGLAARLLDVQEEDLVFEDGRLHPRGASAPTMTIPEIAANVSVGPSLPTEGERILEATGVYDPADYVYPFGTHACAVEVDPETGAVKILKYVAVDDCGRVINPLLVEGQVHGGVLQGIAQALWEEGRYDEEGNLLTSSFLEYPVPTSMESPQIETDRTMTPSPHNPLGLKGIGEAGTIAAPAAVVNAVIDALEPHGISHVDMPVTPEKVFRAVHRWQSRVSC